MPLDSGRPLALPLLDGEPGVGRWVGLSGESTRDPEGTPQAWEWKQLSGPSLGLTDEQAAAPRAWILIQKPGEYGVSLRARNSKGWGMPVPLAFKVAEGPPALPLEEALAPTGAGERVSLPGEAWRQIMGPKVALQTDQDGRETVLRPLKAGLYLFEALRAGDIPERRAILVPPGKDGLMGDRRPTVRLVTPTEGRTGQPVDLDGSLSADLDGDALQAKWASAETTRGVEISQVAGLRARFTAARAGVYRVRLTISDGKLDSEPAIAFITVQGDTEPVRPVAPTALDLPPDADPLIHPVTLSLYHTPDSHLDRAVQRFPSRCGVTLRVDPEFAAPERLAEMPLDLGVKEGPSILLADWIARQTDACYRREPGPALWLTRPGMETREEKLESIVEAADALYTSADGSDLKAILEPCVRGALASRKDTTLAIQKETQKVVAVLPGSAGKRLKEILMHLRLPKGLGLPATPGPTLGELRLRQTLAEKRITADWRHRRLDLLLRDVSESTGVSVGFDRRQFPEGLPRITLKVADCVARDAVRRVVEEAGFNGCQALSAGGLWFYRGDEPYPSGESLWDLALVRSYELEPVLAKLPLLSGEAVAHQIRRRVYPGSWKDPSVCCLYHAATGKLLVVHGEAAHARVLHFLNDVRARGEWALGAPQSGEAAPKER